MIRKHYYTLGTLCLLAVALPSMARAANHDFGTHHQNYAAGTLFPNQYTQAQRDNYVKKYYDQWKTDWLRVDPGGKGYRVVMDNKGRTTSESQGYGMLIVPHMAGHDPNARKIFDGLYTYMRAHPSVQDHRLMDWAQPDGGGDDSAFDGDADMAYGLLLAHAQWGSKGAINYKKEALDIIDGIYESTIGPQSHLPMLGDWVEANGKKYNQWSTRSSDFMYGHFRAFGVASGEEAKWNAVVAATQAATTSLQGQHNTGLLPDFFRVNPTTKVATPVKAKFLEDKRDGKYWYNAGRDPWRIGTDAVINGDAVSKTQAHKLSEFFQNKSNGVPSAIKDGYKLDGTRIRAKDAYFRLAIGVAAMTGTDKADQQWLNALFDDIKTRHENYFNDAITLHSILVMSGNFMDPNLKK